MRRGRLKACLPHLSSSFQFRDQHVAGRLQPFHSIVGTGRNRQLLTSPDGPPHESAPSSYGRPLVHDAEGDWDPDNGTDSSCDIGVSYDLQHMSVSGPAGRQVRKGLGGQ